MVSYNIIIRPLKLRARDAGRFWTARHNISKPRRRVGHSLLSVKGMAILRHDTAAANNYPDEKHIWPQL